MANKIEETKNDTKNEETNSEDTKIEETKNDTKSEETSTNEQTIAQYAKIIEQQQKIIDSNNERIDKLTDQISTLINNGGNYREDPKREYKKPDYSNIDEITKDYADMDFSI